MKLKNKHLAGNVTVYRLCAGLELSNTYPLELDAHLEEDGTYFVTSYLTIHAYGTGRNLKEAVKDYCIALAETYKEAKEYEANNWEGLGRHIEADYRHLIVELETHF